MVKANLKKVISYAIHEKYQQYVNLIYKLTRTYLYKKKKKKSQYPHIHTIYTLKMVYMVYLIESIIGGVCALRLVVLSVAVYPS